MNAERTLLATIQAAGRTITGRYGGGAYIDLHFGDSPAAFDCINVWDYAKDEPTIPAQSSAVKAKMKEWAEAAGESLDHDLREAALSIRR